MSKGKRIILALLPGLLFFLAWPPMDLFFLAFVALVPLFMLEEELSARWSFFGMTYLSMLVFNAATTWWVWFASAGGSVAMLIANSLLMTLPFMLYRFTKKQLGRNRALMGFVFYWLGMEYLHLNWEINWPWLNLGNVFAKHNIFVQWYEYTGMLGGSLWILLLNVFLFLALTQRNRKYIVSIVSTLVLPTLISVIIYFSLSLDVKSTLNVAIIQPNVDPYEKFDAGVEIKNIRSMLALAEAEMHDSTELVLMPETAVVEYIDEDQKHRFQSYDLLRKFCNRHPNIHLVTGASTYNFYDPGEERKATARTASDGSEYESYNTAWELDTSGLIADYHKIRLVPGVEKMPYPSIFGFLERWSIDMGGVSGSLGSDEEPSVFELGNKPSIAPLICYESVFPGFAADFVRKGADVLAVITNDGWWKNTPGHKQHKYYACLRAIENRKDLVRSANTGISCHINAKGKILEEIPWWESGVLNVQAKVYNKQTFFSKYGDYLGRFAAFLSVFFFLSVCVKSLNKHG